MTKAEKAQFAELLLAVGVLKGQLAAATAAPAPTPAPAPSPRAVAESHAEAWLPRMDTMRSSRPAIAIFDDRDAAFAWQKEQGVQPSLGHCYAVSQLFRTPRGYAACAVY